MHELTIDIVESHSAEGLGLQFKSQASGSQYRIAPSRDPNQPRFWRFLVFRCKSSGMADPSEHPWAVNGRMSRDEIPAALDAIRADVGGWLKKPECKELRRWLVSTDAKARTALAATAAAATTAAATRSATAVGASAQGDLTTT